MVPCCNHGFTTWHHGAMLRAAALLEPRPFASGPRSAPLAVPPGSWPRSKSRPFLKPPRPRVIVAAFPRLEASLGPIRGDCVNCDLGEHGRADGGLGVDRGVLVRARVDDPPRGSTQRRRPLAATANRTPPSTAKSGTPRSVRRAGAHGNLPSVRIAADPGSDPRGCARSDDLEAARPAAPPLGGPRQGGPGSALGSDNGDIC